MIPSDSPLPGADAPLRILVCPHELVTGGSQINAIDLAARIRDRGHRVRVYAPPGELQDLIARRGLDFSAAPPFRGDSLRPAVVAALAREVGSFRPHIVHAYESGPSLAANAVSLIEPQRNVTTVMSMSVPDFVPSHVPLFVGTAEIARRLPPRTGEVRLMEPPVDTEHDSPGNARAARGRLGIPADAFVVAVVGRLSKEHQKARGVASAIEELSRAVDATTPGWLVVAGSGDDEELVRRAAASAAQRNPWLTVRLEGNVSDPRDVYDAADVLFGMGSSALRAMAHEKPLIVQGADGFWRLAAPDSIAQFLDEGFFGTGPTGAGFAETVSMLRQDPSRREELGRFGRTLVESRFSLRRATDVLEALYRTEAARPPRRMIASGTRSLLRYGKFRLAMASPRLQRAYRRVRGRHG